MEGREETRYRQAEKADLPALAEIFAAAFPESVEHVSGRLEDAGPLRELFDIAWRADPESMWVAEVEGKVAGYMIAPVRASRIQSEAIWGGGALRLLWNWLRGAYGPRWRALRRAAADKLSFWRNARKIRAVEARLLSMAVHPGYQGRGVGGGLVRRGVEHLEEAGAREIRLEVRPSNAPARKLYERAGFEPVGSYEDSRGEWLVMIRETSSQTN